MSVKIRLMRIGTNRKPFYRVVAVDERKKRTGGYLELLGTYNPLTDPKEINLDQGKIDTWIKKGAQPSYGFLRIIGKAPQRAPRKPKKAPKEAPAEQATSAPAKGEEPAQTEAPVVSEENISEAPQPEAAAEAAAVIEETPNTESPASEEASQTPEENSSEEKPAAEENKE